MTSRPVRFLLLAMSVLALLAFAGCGEEVELEVNEGEPLELGELEFDVQITRFLNPDSTDDGAYLQGAPPLEDGQQYLGVFMQVDNMGDAPNVVPFPFKIIDTRGEIFLQADIDNPFSLIPGTIVEPDQSLPGAGTVARSGSIEGSLILFPIPEASTENRPLQLEVPGPGEPGLIELDL